MTGSLSGIRVVELCTVLAGPSCCQILADHGAEVLKIEPPAGDATRRSPPRLDGQPAYFSGLNRNKEMLALDLSRPAGRDVLLRALGDADVLVENFLPGTMEKWGLGWDLLAARFPRLVLCSISGFGTDGPLGGLPGYDAVLQAHCGLMSINGTTEATRVGIPIVDIATGMQAAMGILMALMERARSGRGQRVEATLHDTALALQHPYGSNFFASGVVPGPVGNGHPNLAPYDKFATRDGGAVFIGLANDAQFGRLAAVLGCPALAMEARFASNPARLANRDALHAAIGPAIARREAGELAEALMRANVPASPVHDVRQAFAHPHAAHRGMRVEIGAYVAPGIPLKLSRTPGSVRSAPRGLAADAAAVLARLGYDATEIETLQSQGALGAPIPGGNP